MPKEVTTKKKVTKEVAKDIQILCSHDEMVDIEKVIPHPRNPNKHPEGQIMLLAKIIKAQGFRRPIVMSKRSGFVTVGHARLEAARYIGMSKVPVDWQVYENEALEYADMIADNRIAELAERDTDMLKELLGDLEKSGDLSDIELTGFTQDDLARMMEGFHFDPLDDVSGGEAGDDSDILAAKIVLKIKDTAIFDEFRNELEKFIYNHWTTKQISIVDR
jgi:hypothetical protein